MVATPAAPWQTELERARQAASLADWSAFQEAIDRLLARWGNHSDALLDASALLLPIGELSQAEALLQWCHQLEPQAPAPLQNLANTWLQSLRQQQAMQLYTNLAEHQPQALQPLANALMALGYGIDQPAQASRQLAQRWAQRLLTGVQPARPLEPEPVPQPGQPLRLGFLSADFCQHPVGLFLLPLAEALAARPDVELWFYCNSPRHDWLSEQLQRCGQWCSVRGLSDQALAARIRSDKLAVLVELGGHTAGSRLAVLAQQPAPLQLSWLGYWATTGLPLDGVLVDPLEVPPGSPEASSFVEPLLWLPKTRWVYRPVPWMPAVVDPPCLQRGWITFGSFNSAAKWNGPLLRCWAAVLKAVPGSRLRLKNYQLRDQGLRQRLRQLMEAEGVAPERLELEGPSFHQDLLAAYGAIDIALDCFPFNGGLTSCEALWLGLPLVSMAGHNQAAVMAARQGLALLELIGRPQWIATSVDQYVTIATTLAANPQALQEIRHSQRQRIGASVLCDEQGFADAWLGAVVQRLPSGSRNPVELS